MPPIPPDRQATTEQIESRYADLDSWPTATMLSAMLEAQLEAVAAVRAALPALAAAAEDAAVALRRGGRLVYAGAGTSGRIGVQDGAELTPTFDWPPERLVFLMAGGEQALIRSVEGAEDSDADGARAAAEARIGTNDVVIGVAASGNTPYTIGVLRAAQTAGAVTIAVSSNADAPLFEAAQHRIFVETGGEVIAGSTRMKAGTAQKIVLNLFSTALMVKLGRVYRGLMVHMRASNAKLRKRAVRIVQQLSDCDERNAKRYLETADGDLKLAVLLALGAARENAASALAKHDGNLRLAIAELNLSHD